MNKDLATGAVLLGVSAFYWLSIGSIAESSLADEVGAAGLPRLLTYALVALALVLILKAALAMRATAASPTSGPPEENEEDQNARLPRAFGFVGLGALYVLLLPVLGYLVSSALLIGAVAIYEGARLSWTVPAAAIGGATLYWAIFVKLLGVNQPVGSLFARVLS